MSMKQDAVQIIIYLVMMKVVHVVKNGIDLDEAVALAKVKDDSHHAHAKFETTDYSSPLSIIAAPFIGLLGIIDVSLAITEI